MLQQEARPVLAALDHDGQRMGCAVLRLEPAIADEPFDPHPVVGKALSIAQLHVWRALIDL